MKIAIKNVLNLYLNQVVRIDLREKNGDANAWTGRTFGDYNLVGIESKNKELIVKLEATETKVRMDYFWNDEFKLILRPITDLKFWEEGMLNDRTIESYYDFKNSKTHSFNPSIEDVPETEFRI